MNEQINISFEQAVNKIQALSGQLNSCLIGQEDVTKKVLITLLANGHALIEGVPGLGKTMLVRVLASCFGGEFKRIQFTPDLMPSDITGHVLYDMNTKTFKMNKGPIFTNLLLADEINRAPAKSQAALLEVMQERQVTLDGDAHKVLITHNNNKDENFQSLPAIINADDLIQFQQIAANITVDDQVMDYAVRIVRATRQHVSIYRGAGTRACISLVRAAKSLALISGREFVLPDDIKALAVDVIQHRITLSPEVEIEGQNAVQVIQRLLEDIEAPRQ